MVSGKRRRRNLWRMALPLDNEALACPCLRSGRWVEGSNLMCERYLAMVHILLETKACCFERAATY